MGLTDTSESFMDYPHNSGQILSSRRGLFGGLRTDAAEIIVGISLSNPATIRFRPWPPDVLTSRRAVSFEVIPCSIYKPDGKARWGWQHAVPTVKYPLWSITLRVKFPSYP